MGNSMELRVPLVACGCLIIIVVGCDGMAIGSVHLANAMLTVHVKELAPVVLVDLEVFKVFSTTRNALIAIDRLVL